LEQWAVLAAVVDSGGYAQAAAALNKSQSAVSYIVARLQESLDMPLLSIEGRRSILTEQGKTLLARARTLLVDALVLEQLARSLKHGWEAELDLVVDAAFPQSLTLAIIAELQDSCPATQFQLTEEVLSGAEEAIVAGRGDVVVTSRVPAGYLGDHLLDVEFVAVARPDHPLFDVEGELGMRDLARHMQAVVRDSGSVQPRSEGWLGATRRFTVSSMEASIAALLAGLAYAWLPEHAIAAHLRAGTLRRLPLSIGGSRTVSLHIVLAHADTAGPAARAALDSFRRRSREPREVGRSGPT
jgi:DNA-binding transcriptional LysR family regulator